MKKTMNDDAKDIKKREPEHDAARHAKRAEGLLQFIKFALVGVSNTLISEGIYAVLVFFKMHYIPASFIGFSLSVINAYYWNHKYVFKENAEDEKRVWWKVFCKTYVAYFWG